MGKEGRRVLVTGASGFIGSHLVGALRQRGERVRVLARRRIDRFDREVEVVTGDITDPVAVEKAAQGMEVIFHLAAQRTQWGVPTEQYEAINVKGTEHVLEAARRVGARLVHCSTVGVAEQAGGHDLSEATPYGTVDRHPNPYHLSKIKAEKLVREAIERYGQAATIVRPTVAYGPGDERGMITQLIARLRSGFFVYAGRGDNRTHLVYIDDLIDGMLLAGDAEVAQGQIYILTGAEPIRFRELVERICALLQAPKPPIHVPSGVLYLGGEVISGLYSLLRLQSEPPITPGKVDTIAKDCTFSIEKARRELGYNPQIGYEEGLARSVRWFLEGPRHAVQG